MSVRPVTIEELPQVVGVGFQFFKEGDLPGGFVPDVFIRNWTSLLSEDRGVFFGLFKEDRFVGGLGAVICPDLNNGQLMAVETFWYVQPQHRGRGLRLLREFEKWAKERGARRVAMLHLLKLHPAEMNTLYKRLGYRPVEVNYIKEL